MMPTRYTSARGLYGACVTDEAKELPNSLRMVEITVDWPNLRTAKLDMPADMALALLDALSHWRDARKETH